jgi:DNA (cytosine-5)-methyltransferase 1
VLFSHVVPIIELRKPLVIVIENVKQLVTHDSGRSIAALRQCLHDLGYTTAAEILNASHYSICQSRQRVYLSAFRKDLGINRFVFPSPTFESVRLRDVLLPANETGTYMLDEDPLNITLRRERLGPCPEQTVFRPILVGHYGRGRQAQKIYHADGHARTIMSATWGKIANLAGKTGLYWVDGTIRCLAPREVARCFGLPDSFLLHEDDEVAIQHLGNSVVVDVVQRILISMVKQGVFGTGCRDDGGWDATRRPSTEFPKPIKDHQTKGTTNERTQHSE